ncbi:hypothetical protein, partial [Endobacter medicaginis]|uniref:hypothetical protein n=1 Tax=Endobacter medicaginis TaxID=1181271 RepID=UPI001C400725
MQPEEAVRVRWQLAGQLAGDLDVAADGIARAAAGGLHDRAKDMAQSRLSDRDEPVPATGLVGHGPQDAPAALDHGEACRCLGHGFAPPAFVKHRPRRQQRLDRAAGRRVDRAGARHVAPLR